MVRQSNNQDVEEIIPNIVSLWFQAKYGTGAAERLAPWNISTAETIEKRREQN